MSPSGPQASPFERELIQEVTSSTVAFTSLDKSCLSAERTHSLSVISLTELKITLECSAHLCAMFGEPETSPTVCDLAVNLQLP